MGRREVFCDLYSITVLPHCPVCFCTEVREIQWLLNNLITYCDITDNKIVRVTADNKNGGCACTHVSVYFRRFSSYRAAILQYTVGEAAVALRSDLHVIGALQQHSLLQVARGGVHVGHAVLAVVGEVLRGLSRKQP